MNEQIIPLRDNIVFQFVDQVKDGKFVEHRKSGLVSDMGNDYLRYGALSRAIKVVSIGPDVDNVVVGGEYVVENLKWTRGFNFNGAMHWMTRPAFLLGSVQR